MPSPAITLVLDWWPTALKPNGSRGHPIAHNAVAQRYRDDIRILARDQAQKQGLTAPLEPPVSAEIIFAVRTKQDRDLDNCLASFKHGIDGIVAAGVLPSDSCWQLTEITLKAAHVPYMKVDQVHVLLRAGAGR